MNRSTSQAFKCRFCGGQPKRLGDEVCWIIIDGQMGIIRQVTRSGKRYVTIIENKKFCSIQCLNDYMWREIERSRRKEQKISKRRKGAKK